MADDDQCHGPPAPAAHDGSTADAIDSATAAETDRMIEDLRKIVEELESIARSLKAVQNRSRFKIID